MLTDSAMVVNKPEVPAGLWLSVTELAKARGISKPAVTQAIKRWAAQGITVSTHREDGSQRSVLVNVAEFDRARGESGDLSRLMGEQTKRAEQSSADPVYAREQARRAAYDADLAMIKRDEMLGRLVPVEEVTAAAIACGEAAVRAVQLSNHAEDLADAVAKNGVTGARSALKAIERDVRQRMTEEFSRLPASAAALGKQLVEEPTE